MSHEFLTSLHSHVIETSGAKTIGAMGKVEQLAAKRSRGRPRTEATGGERHRTVGVSMSPKLQARTAARAREVGLSFSRYVQWCLEAELDQVPLAERFRPLE
ncbi:MAG TPA: hypothetical protein VHC95_09430 [Opitutales bacterium]|nr:hypothetical protein [Opitutales bacterium]